MPDTTTPIRYRPVDELVRLRGRARLTQFASVRICIEQVGDAVGWPPTVLDAELAVDNDPARWLRELAQLVTQLADDVDQALAAARAVRA